jgi:ATP-binding cassette subfamily B (MDR/TAP) protein 1
MRASGWKLGLVVVFGAGPFILGSGYIRIRMDQKLENEAGERFAESAGLATEAVTSIRTISSLTLGRSHWKIESAHFMLLTTMSILQNHKSSTSTPSQWTSSS